MKELEQLKSQRIDTFDLIRGYFLFVILINHLGRFFGVWEIFTGRGALWVSAAEGFFFVSGIMIGMVRGRKLATKPFRETWGKLWSRAWVLYLWAVGLTLFFSAIAGLISGADGLKSGIYSGQGFGNFWLDTFTLRFNYGWGDFLNYYAVYLFAAPLAVWLIRKKLWYIVIMLSLIVWINSEKLTGSWNILFFSGLTVGYYKDELEKSFRRLKLRVRKMIVSLIYGLSLATLSLSVFFTTIAGEYGKEGESFFGLDLSGARAYGIENLRPLFEKSSLSPLRLALFYLWFTALYLIVKKHEGWIKEKLGWILLVFGRNSLYVYIVHAVILYFLDIAIPGGQHWIENFIISTGFIATIWFMAKKRILFRVIPS
jgi:hypothetical protein